MGIYDVVMEYMKNTFCRYVDADNLRYALSHSRVNSLNNVQLLKLIQDAQEAQTGKGVMD